MELGIFERSTILWLNDMSVYKLSKNSGDKICLHVFRWKTSNVTTKQLS